MLSFRRVIERTLYLFRRSQETDEDIDIENIQIVTRLVFRCRVWTMEELRG